MNELTNNLTNHYEPHQAIVVYKTQDKKYYLETHRIQNGAMMEGKPLTGDSIRDMVSLFKTNEEEETKISGLIPDCLLACNQSHKRILIWYRPSQLRPMYFIPSLHIKDGTAYQPALLFVAEDDSLDVYALPNNSRPTPKTVIMRAPYHNVSEAGSVCLGNAKVKNARLKTYTDYIEYFEKLFFGSKFSHIRDESPIKGNLNTYWKKAIATKQPFDNRILLKTSNKVADIYEGVDL